MSDTLETIVIGAGQAGLAMSYYLKQVGREHLLLERARIAERWHSERWDSLAFQFPNAMLRLPDYLYNGADPEGFMGREGVAEFITGYAKHTSAPVRCGVNVTSLRPAGDGRLTLEAGQATLQARNVVVATGPYQLPAIPRCSASFPLSIQQITANRYRRPDDLPPGAVLVVGSGGSGCQIADDLVQAGRRVFYSIRRHRRVPRRYRGHDVGWWFETTGMIDMTAENLPPLWRDFKAPMMTGVEGGRTVDLREISRRGVTLLGGLIDTEDGVVHFARDLNQNLKIGDDTFVQFTRSVDEFAAKHALTIPEEHEFDPYLRDEVGPLPEINRLALRAANITTVIWATGYRFDFGWIDCPVFDGRGAPIHKRGVTTAPGLYFLGLPRLHKIKSAFLWGVGEDAEYLADHIATRRDRT